MTEKATPADHHDAPAVDDRDLVAYVDGELPEPARERVAAAIAGDAGLARRAERMLTARDAATGGLAGVLSATVPDRLRQAVLAGPSPRPTWRQALDDLTRSWGWRLGAPAGALVVGALVAVLAISVPLRSPSYLPASGDPATALPPEAQLALMDLLAGDASAAAQVSGDGWAIDITPGALAAFECRAFLYRLDGASNAGLACRSPAGGWRVTTMPSGGL